MLKQHASPNTLADAIRYFADADTSFAFVVQMRWPNGVTCPRCSADKPSLIRSRRIWECKACHKQFSIKVGTKVRNIRLVDRADGHDIDCKVDGFGHMQLTSSIVKKV